MVSVDLFEKSGKKKGELDLLEALAQMKVIPALVHQAVVREQANARRGTAATKTRGMIRGGGAKPYRQKGTGRARAGSNRSPLWVGGGTIFGPQPRSYSKKMNRKMRQAAIKSIVRDKADNGWLKVVEKLELKEAKTKEFVKLLGKMKIDGKVLIVMESEDSKLKLASRNVKRVKLLPVSSLNAFDLLKYQDMLITEEALAMIGGNGSNAESA